MSAKIVVLTDVHANLPALEAVLGAVRAEGYDALYHTGDAIAIGPHPRECLELLLSLERPYLLKGNHDLWYGDRLPDPQPAWMSDGELEHQHWTHAQLGPGFREAVAGWPFWIKAEFEGVWVWFTHYGLEADGRTYQPLVTDPSPSDLNALFAGVEADIVFFGHDHAACDLRGGAHYVNPGSLGCQRNAVATYAVVEFQRGGYRLRHCQAAYDDLELYRAFEDRQVPARAFIYKAFLGGRFQVEQAQDTGPGRPAEAGERGQRGVELPNAILFDLDDTILSMTGSADRCWRDMCERFAPRVEGLTAGRLFDAIGQVRSWFWGDSERVQAWLYNVPAARREIVAEAFARLGLDEPTLAIELADTYSAEQIGAVYPFPGALEALRWLRGQELRLALVTNGSAELQRLKIERFGLDRLFDHMLISGEFGVAKPDGRVYRHVLRQLGVEPGEAWMVGDDLDWDVAASQRLGLVGVWVDWAGAGLPEGSLVRPDRIVGSLAELVGQLDRQG